MLHGVGVFNNGHLFVYDFSCHTTLLFILFNKDWWWRSLAIWWKIKLFKRHWMDVSSFPLPHTLFLIYLVSFLLHHAILSFVLFLSSFRSSIEFFYHPIDNRGGILHSTHFCLLSLQNFLLVYACLLSLKWRFLRHLKEGKM